MMRYRQIGFCSRICIAILFGVALIAVAGLFARGGENRSVRLPAPLDAVALDVGALGNSFEVVKVEFFPPGEFTVPPDRVAAEDTLVVTLRAKEKLASAEMNKLLANPFPRVRFTSEQDGKESDADARSQGYGLYHDGRWLSARHGPDLKSGETLLVWTHLGNEGAKALIAKHVTKARFEKKNEEAPKKP